MRWTMLDVGSSREIFDLPRRIGVEVGSKCEIEYRFFYLNSVSPRTRVYHLEDAEVSVERGSCRVVRVLLYPSSSCDIGMNARMEDAVRRAFSKDGRIDAKESRFLSIIDEHLVRSRVFEK